MPTLTLRPSHKAVAAYYESLAAFRTLGEEHEQAVRSAFAALLETAAKPFGWKLVPEHSMRVKGGKRIQPDGTLMDLYRLHHGHWEAKDSKDDLDKEIRAKLDKGYPTKNLLFWEPRRAVLYQHLLTERILRKTFDIENFRERNVIATLSARHFCRNSRFISFAIAGSRAERSAAIVRLPACRRELRPHIPCAAYPQSGRGNCARSPTKCSAHRA